MFTPGRPPKHLFTGLADRPWQSASLSSPTCAQHFPIPDHSGCFHHSVCLQRLPPPHPPPTTAVTRHLTTPTLPPATQPSPAMPHPTSCLHLTSPVTATVFNMPPPPRRHQDEVAAGALVPGCTLGRCSWRPCGPHLASYSSSSLGRSWLSAMSCFKHFR
jgi:hypothetical protein